MNMLTALICQIFTFCLLSESQFELQTTTEFHLFKNLKTVFAEIELLRERDN